MSQHYGSYANILQLREMCDYLALAKKNITYKFNSYVVDTERETKNLHSELSLPNSLSRAQHGKISDKKIETMASKPIVATRSFLQCSPS